MHEDEGLSPPREGMTLPQRFFVCPDLFRKETERLFHASWFCVGRREQLAAPGDYFLADVAGENLIVTIDDQHVPHAYFNVCRHRGCRLTTEQHGQFSHCRIRCPYHRWTYDCQGELLAAPNMSEDFKSEEWPLHVVKLAQWQGFLFVNLAENPVPIEEAFAPFWHQLTPWRTTDLQVAHGQEYELATNWKMIFQNFNECYHCRSVHPGLDDLSPVEGCSNEFNKGPFLGGPMQLSSESMTLDGRRTAPTIRTLDDDQKQRVYYYTMLPNMMFAMHPEYVLAWRIEPQGPGQTKITAQWLYEPEALQQPDFDPQRAVDFWDRTNRQDWDICQTSYAGVQSKAYRPGPWSTSESIPRAFDESVLDVLQS